MTNPTITKHDLIELGYGHCTAEDLIKRAKALMVHKGFSYYENARLGRVPVKAIEEILGIQLAVKPIEEVD
ncbi:hypothetical protein DOK78_002620 [Enterococcus sp. DIV2402]|uniref:DUF3173 domain-containing protein n=1 Tax=Candidatus Enterococcus lowellii TaxID=2230877 RepID=A0ABZ2SQG5_9ENTE|nr:DUF3173 domain-containing protein [Enterococcus sp. DIV2402]MBO0463268.1 DUF3173 domain-containing protein [Enterococcus sp. DIV2402]